MCLINILLKVIKYGFTIKFVKILFQHIDIKDIRQVHQPLNELKTL